MRLTAVIAGAAAVLAAANDRAAAQSAPPKSAAAFPVDDAVTNGVEHLLSMQEGAAQWPYEGVYRVRGEIPIGYRVGGTAICAESLLAAPGYADDEERRSAVRSAVAFVAAGIDHPLMSIDDYAGGYDVRCWGYIYGLKFLLRLNAEGHVPDDLAEEVDRAIAFYLDGIQRLEIGATGGWNYARGRGVDAPSRAAPFMTAPALQVLFRAREQGHEVDPEVVDRGLSSLERARAHSGAFAYAHRTDSPRARVPGAIARMPVCESTLFLAGRADAADIRGSIDAFIVHWKWLDARRAQHGTHIPPYGIAPYYFYFGHRYAAEAVELLPEPERADYRERLNELLFSVRLDDGTWNDRVFDRSANYGTAMALMALLAPGEPAPARWPQSSSAERGE